MRSRKVPRMRSRKVLVLGSRKVLWWDRTEHPAWSHRARYVIAPSTLHDRTEHPAW